MKRKKFSINTCGLLVAIGLFLFNFFDAILTVYVLSNNLGIELSPIAAAMMAWGFGPFVLIKTSIGLVAAAMFALCWNNYKLARFGGVIALALYAAIAIYHIVGLLLL